MTIPLLLIIFIIWLAWSFYIKNRAIEQTEIEGSFLRNVVSRKFYVDEIYEAAIQKPVAGLSTFFHDVVELKVIDKLVNQTGVFVVWVGRNIRYMQTGNVGAYLFYMVVSIILILVLNLFK
jgi:NADH-quinone oxidoreductase subunit L